MRTALVIALGVAAGGISVATPAAAQDTPPTTARDDDNGDIIVTATRREQSAQDVPAALTAFDEQFIDDMRLTSARDFTQLIPNAVFEEGGFNINQTVSIRGVRPGQDISEPSFGYYRDGHYMGGLRTNFSDFMDLQRVEVLRGPQGGLYGRNAVGGAVNFIYNEPELDRTSGRGEIGYSTHDRVEARGTINVPIVEGELAARFNAWFVDQNGGQFYNITIGEVVDQYESAGARAQLLWRPSSNLRFRWTAERSRQQTPEVVGVQPNQGETDRTIVSDTSSRADKDWTFLAQGVDWETGAGTVTLLTSYRNYQLRSQGDQDGGANPLLQQTIRRFEDSDAYYVELLWVSPASWPVSFVAGVDLFGEDFSLRRPVTCVGASCATSRSQTSFTIDTSSIAVFGEATWHVASTLDVIASARYNHDKKDFNFLRQVFNPAGVQTTNIPVQDSATFNNTSFGGAVQWRPTDNLNFYVRVNEGFRAGGYNTGIFGTAFEIARLPFDAETSVNYEVGARTTWLDGALTVNAAAFRLKQRNLQAFLPDAFGQFFVENLGRSSTDGLELEVAIRPSRQLEISGGIGWIDGELTGGVDSGGPLAGQGILFGNGVNWNLNGIYRIPLGPDRNIILQASWRRNNPKFGGVPVTFRVGDLNDYLNVSNVDASIAYEANHWRLRAYVTNLTDHRYILSESLFPPVPAGSLINYNADRRFGIEAIFDF